MNFYIAERKSQCLSFPIGLWKLHSVFSRIRLQMFSWPNICFFQRLLVGNVWQHNRTLRKDIFKFLFWKNPDEAILSKSKTWFWQFWQHFFPVWKNSLFIGTKEDKMLILSQIHVFLICLRYNISKCPFYFLHLILKYDVITWTNISKFLQTAS